VFGLLCLPTYFWSSSLSTRLWSLPFIYLYLVSFLYLLILGLLPLSTCFWSLFVYLYLVCFLYLLIFGFLPLSTRLWSPPFIYLYLVSFLYLVICSLLPLSTPFVLLLLCTYVWSPSFYLFIFGLLLIFGLFFFLYPPFNYLSLVSFVYLISVSPVFNFTFFVCSFSSFSSFCYNTLFILLCSTSDLIMEQCHTCV
jgi:hypothetical protein